MKKCTRCESTNYVKAGFKKVAKGRILGVHLGTVQHQWTSIAVTSTGKYFYFYHLSKRKTAYDLFEFHLDLPNTENVYSDGNFSYDKVYGSKAIMKKSKITNIIENLNSQIRDKISYLVRRSKAHAKSFD